MTDRTMKRNPVSIPHTIWHADDIRRGEREAVDALGLTLYELMLRAGEATFQVYRSAYPDTRHQLVPCGYGSNDGDGYIIARLATAVGIEVTLLTQESNKPLPEKATLAREARLNAGGEIHASDIIWPKSVDLIVDVLLGTGLQQAPRESTSQLIDHANFHLAPIAAVDIPSSLLAETGATPGAVINADHAITFVALKPGLLTGKARDITGQLHFNSLGLDNQPAGQETKIQRFSAEQPSHWLESRRPASHKGDHGRPVIIGGDHGTARTIRMVREAVLRTGTGLVQVLTRSKSIAPLLAARPELMAHELTTDSPIGSLEWTDVVMIGPGLGQQKRGKKALQKVKNFHKPMLWDADALNLLTTNLDKRHNRTITPHPGEATRLLSCSVAEIKSDRLRCVKRLVQRYGDVVVLKGAGTVAATRPGALGIIGAENVGMVSGSVGGVLSSITGALLRQKLSSYDTVCAGCVAHDAVAGILVARFGTHGVLVTDLFPTLQRIVNPEMTDKNHDESSNSAP